MLFAMGEPAKIRSNPRLRIIARVGLIGVRWISRSRTGQGSAKLHEHAIKPFVRSYEKRGTGRRSWRDSFVTGAITAKQLEQS